MGKGLESRFRIRHLSKERIMLIIKSHEIYGGNSAEVSRELSHDSGTIKKYWRQAGLVAEGKGGFRLSQEEVDKIIEEYRPCNKNASEIARRSKHNPATVRKYLREAGLEIRRRGGSLIQEEIDKVIKFHKICDRNARKTARQSGHCPPTVIKYWEREGLKAEGNSRYKNYGGPLGYYLAHPEKYEGLSRFGVFKIDQPLYRALLRHGEMDKAIPGIIKGNRGRPRKHF